LFPTPFCELENTALKLIEHYGPCKKNVDFLLLYFYIFRTKWNARKWYNKELLVCSHCQVLLGVIKSGWMNRLNTFLVREARNDWRIIENLD
jgi:hypothetical protein